MHVHVGNFHVYHPKRAIEVKVVEETSLEVGVWLQEQAKNVAKARAPQETTLFNQSTR